MDMTARRRVDKKHSQKVERIGGWEKSGNNMKD